MAMIYYSNFHSPTTLATSLEAETHHLVFPSLLQMWVRRIY